ncbi:hypothetical protein ACI76O_11660, partial [Capnocytophaga cynodegmi]|uniref:hypothetical protein n=1 Tax=Capnocytophaga cynodegmi TaxID=28189 RepID=UPI00385945B6
MKNKLYFLLVISLVLCNRIIAQNCAVVELTKDFSRNSELKEILQESNHFKAWRILFSERPALRTSTPEIKLVAENLTQIEKSGGYNRWIELLAAEEKNVPVLFLDSQKKIEEKVNVSKLPKHLKALTYQYYKKANNENKPHLWKRIEEIFTDYNINAKYPPYNGGYNIKDNVAISQYAKYDRYCNPIGKWDGTSEPILGGNFTSPIVNDKPFDFPSRALNLPQTDYKIYFEIEVLDAADLKGQLADVIPWFNQKGQGKQMMWYLPTDPNTNYPKTWNQLAQEGKIRITIKDVQSTDPNLLKWKGKVLGKKTELADDLVVKMKHSKKFFTKIKDFELDNITEITNNLSDASRTKFFNDIKHLSDEELKLLNNNTEFLDEWQNIEKMENAAKKQKLPEWLQKIKEGSEFNKARAKHYPYNEIYLEKPEGVGGKGKYVILDSYDPAKGEIISRKYTQFSEITEETGLNYLRELA